MRELWAFIKKETWHIIRDRRTVMIMLILPIILMILFGFAIRTEIDNINIAVVVPHESESIRRYIEKIDANPYFNVIGKIENNDVDRLLRREKAAAVVVFAGDFDRIMEERRLGNGSAPAVQFIVDAANSNTATTVVSYLNGIFTDPEYATAIPEAHMLYNPQMMSSYNFVPGIMGLIFILICSMMTSVSIVKEKETGTMEVLLVSPVKHVNILVAKMVPYFLLSCINLATILLIAKFLLGVPMSGNLLPIIGISVLYLILSLAIGMLISSVTQKQVTALIVSGMVMLTPCLLLSGMLFPIENIPKALQWLSYIIPSRWYIDAVKKLMIEGVAFRVVLNDTIILLAMIIVTVAASLLTFKDKLV